MCRRHANPPRACTTSAIRMMIITATSTHSRIRSAAGIDASMPRMYPKQGRACHRPRSSSEGRSQNFPGPGCESPGAGTSLALTNMGPHIVTEGHPEKPPPAKPTVLFGVPSENSTAAGRIGHSAFRSSGGAPMGPKVPNLLTRSRSKADPNHYKNRSGLDRTTQLQIGINYL